MTPPHNSALIAYLEATKHLEFPEITRVVCVVFPEPASGTRTGQKIKLLTRRKQADLELRQRQKTKRQKDKRDKKDKPGIRRCAQVLERKGRHHMCSNWYVRDSLGHRWRQQL